MLISFLSAMSSSVHLTLQFDGCLRGGRAGGAGALLFGSAMSHPIWEAGRFISRPQNCAACEYEGLILGLREAKARRPTSLHIQGDCKLVIGQMSGEVSLP